MVFYQTIITALLTTAGAIFINFTAHTFKNRQIIYSRLLEELYAPLHQAFHKFYFLRAPVNEYGASIEIETAYNIIMSHYLLAPSYIVERISDLYERKDDPSFAPREFFDFLDSINSTFEYLKRQLGYPSSAKLFDFSDPDSYEFQESKSGIWSSVLFATLMLSVSIILLQFVSP